MFSSERPVTIAKTRGRRLGTPDFVPCPVFSTFL